MKSHHLDKYMPEAISGVSNKLRFRKAATVLDQRDAERVPLRTYVSYMTDEAERAISWSRLAR